MGSEKKGGGGLDDLKARLGLDSVLSRAKKEPEKPAPEPADQAGPAPGEAAAPQAPGTPPAPPPVEQAPTNYAEEVSTFEEPVAGEGEPDPVLTDSHKLVDLNLAVPVSKGARIALVVVTVVAVVAALAAGFGFGKVMRDREVAEEVIQAASTLADEMGGLGTELQSFRSALAGYGNDYDPELHAIFVDTYEGGGPILSSRMIADARVIMTTGEDLARDLLNYALSTQVLQAVVQEHLRKTLSDRRLITSLLEAQGQRPRNYGVVFSWDDASERFRQFYEAPEESTFIPARGLVATFDTLEMEIPNPDAENPVYQYPVMIGGQQERVAVYNLIVVDADQFVSNPNEETALTRYASRVARIREYVDNVLATHEILVEQLRARAGESSAVEPES